MDLASLPLADEIPEDVVVRALRSFPADTAPGPSGLRVQHLREAGPAGMTHSTFEHLTRLVNLLVQGRSTIPFAGGVQQGDPLGPLLFATAIHTLTQELRSGPLDLAFFYLDDGVIAGAITAVGAALAHIQRRGGELGLALNLSKCEVVGVGSALPATTLAQHLPRELLHHPDGRSRLQQNFELLGAAIGDDSFLSAHTHDRVQAAGPLLDALAAIGDAQVGLRLLRWPWPGHA
eukprot:s1049_g35.t1